MNDLNIQKIEPINYFLILVIICLPLSFIIPLFVNAGFLIAETTLLSMIFFMIGILSLALYLVSFEKREKKDFRSLYNLIAYISMGIGLASFFIILATGYVDLSMSGEELLSDLIVIFLMIYPIVTGFLFFSFALFSKKK